jgi:serine/threonine protein kinase
VKKLRKDANNTGTIGFDREFDALVHISEKKNPHLMQLLTAFQHGEDFFLLFPLADCNLKDCFGGREYVGDTQYFKWMLEQLVGLASGILAIHEGNSSELAVPGKEKIGYHHDLKPENILLCRRSRVGEPKFSAAEELFGRLQICDFGLGRFRDPATGSRSFHIKGTPAYAAPESKSEKHQSRPYDIWSFGCIVLEILIWLVKGRQGREAFLQSKCVTFNQSEASMSSYTGQPTSAPSSAKGTVTTESYWVQEGKKYRVNPAVLDHMTELRKHKTPRGYDAIVKDLLNLVKDCLEVSKERRPKAATVVARMKQIHAKAP